MRTFFQRFVSHFLRKKSDVERFLCSFTGHKDKVQGTRYKVQLYC